MAANTQNWDIDDPSLIFSRKAVLKRKKFLARIYYDWYQLIKSFLPVPNSLIIELGSGAGFLENSIPKVIKSDVFFQPFVNLILSAQALPFENNRIDALLLVDVFHHIPNVQLFFEEAQRTLRSGGRIVMVEPWITVWSRKAYALFHYEPLEMQSDSWDFESTGPLSGSNLALPWLVFNRDRRDFESLFPHLSIIHIQPMMPFRYIFSGGLTSRFGLPGICYSVVNWFENLFKKKMDQWAMFALIVIEKTK